MNHDVVLTGDKLVPITVLTMQLLADLLTLVFTVEFTLPNLLIYDLIVLAEQTRSRAQRFQAGTKVCSYLRTIWPQFPTLGVIWVIIVQDTLARVYPESFRY